MNHKPTHPLRIIATGLAIIAGGTALAVAGQTIAPEPVSKTAADAIERVLVSNGEHTPHVIHCPDVAGPVVPCSIEYADGINVAAHYRPATGEAGTGWN